MWGLVLAQSVSRWSGVRQSFNFTSLVLVLVIGRAGAKDAVLRNPKLFCSRLLSPGSPLKARAHRKAVDDNGLKLATRSPKP